MSLLGEKWKKSAKKVSSEDSGEVLADSSIPRAHSTRRESSTGLFVRREELVQLSEAVERLVEKVESIERRLGVLEDGQVTITQLDDLTVEELQDVDFLARRKSLTLYAIFRELHIPLPHENTITQMAHDLATVMPDLRQEEVAVVKRHIAKEFLEGNPRPGRRRKTKPRP